MIVNLDNDGYEILDGVITSDIRLGDQIVGWDNAGMITAPGSYPDIFIVDSIGERITYLTKDEPSLGSRTVSTGGAVRWFIRRKLPVLPRVPCRKCGKSFHPALSASVGVTHGC